MKQKKVVFGDSEIVEFCRTTLDTNEIHDPAYMETLGKRVIVPGLFVLSKTAVLSADFLKNHARSLKIHFNSLISSGDLVTLRSSSLKNNPLEVRLSAILRKDTMTSRDEYTRLSVKDTGFRSPRNGTFRNLEIKQGQVEKFMQLISTGDGDIGHFLFAISYASQALLRIINEPETEIEAEIKDFLTRNPGISPFYYAIEIHIPQPFPVLNPSGALDYFVQFEREKAFKLYNAILRCEHHGILVFAANYKIMAIACGVLHRMAKEVKRHRAD